MSNQLLMRRRTMLGQSKEITLHGIPPISIIGKRNLLSVKAFGNCVQNGIPTPDNPVDIVCNNGVLKVDNQGNVYADGMVETIKISPDGSTATAEMLLKVGNYKDVQSILDGVVTRNVGVKVFDGTENWSNPFNNGRYVLNFPSTTIYVGASTNLYCSHFKATAEATVGLVLGCGIYANTASSIPQIRLTYPDINVLEDFKTWLSQQYVAGTPVIVVYQQSTPTTEQVIGQTFALTSSTNVIDITQASLQGLELEVRTK